MRDITLGTAGHVDHGKTALIKALTGIDTDRLKEEKARGITIELGFAHLVLPDGITVGIVDVPGHERFVKHMVAGATGIDCVALVIAADEGIMPQTKEHLAICSLLGVKTGLIALTKIDLVDDEWLALVTEDIREFTAGTFLEGAPIIPLSSVTGVGLKDFIRALSTLFAAIEEREEGEIFRLPIDRVFTARGFGTIVTGTVASGRLALGDEVVVMPQGKKGRIRGLQCHGTAVELVRRGQRAAANIPGLDREEIDRGNVLCPPNTLLSSPRLDAFLSTLPDTVKSIKNRQIVRLHVGTTEVMARLTIVGNDALTAGEDAYVQFFTEAPLALMGGDRFVIRAYSPITTLGGGVILDPLPRKYKRSDKGYRQDLETLHHGTLEERLITFLNRAEWKGVTMQELVLRTGEPSARIRPLLETIATQRKVILMKEEERLVSTTVYQRLKERMREKVAVYHEKYPLKEGLPREELRQAVGEYVSPRLFAQALADLERAGSITVEKERVRATHHHVTLGHLETLKTQLEMRYRAAGLMPPSRREILATFSDAKDASTVLDMLLREGILVKVCDDFYFHRDPLARLREDYREMLLREEKATPISFKELTGLTRKYAIPLMEYFDTQKLTIRMGDYRVLRTKS